jgi:import inner membrane translocase subunit TIM23
MSVRSIFTGRMGLSTAGAVARTSQIGSQGASAQLARLHSTAVRPSCAIQNQDLRPHVRASTLSQSRPAGLRAQSTSAGAKDEVKLDWDSFFKLRASRRRYSLSSSIISSLVSTSVGVQVLSSQDLESLGAQVMGLDPFVVLGMATAACGAIGWLVGPAVGNGVWGLVYRRYKPSVATVSFSRTRIKA